MKQRARKNLQVRKRRRMKLELPEKIARQLKKKEVRNGSHTDV